MPRWPEDSLLQQKFNFRPDSKVIPARLTILAGRRDRAAGGTSLIPLNTVISREAATRVASPVSSVLHIRCL